MTRDNLDELLELTLEMEGLITLMMKREDMTPPRVTSLLGRKAARFNALLSLLPSQPAAQPEPVAVPETAAEAIVEHATAAAEAEEAAEECCAAQQQEENQEIAQAVEMEQEEDAEPMRDEAPAEVEAEDVPVSEPQEPQIAAEEPAHRAHEPKKIVFTINDKFRFKRSLFDNSDEEFKGTMAIIGDMNSMDEVVDYLYNDLCLDPENEDVKAFVDVLSRQI